MTIGIDTSCYRTSVALAEDRAIRAQRRRLLSVPAGERGLRQSEGVFQHVRALGPMVQELLGDAPGARIDAVCASDRPRDLEDSYMPVFQVGASYARAIAAALGVPVYFTSHQKGHLRAALVGQRPPVDSFLALHLSGGTTEILLADRQLSAKRLGGTSDLNAGQLVDRAGVALGLSFPAGPELERLAEAGKSQSRIPAALNGLNPSFSGAEARVMKMLAGGLAKEDAAREIYECLARTIAKMIERAAEESGARDALLAGGVASSGLLRMLLQKRLLRDRCPVRLIWADPALSGDNAAGVALMGESFLNGSRGGNKSV